MQNISQKQIYIVVSQTGTALSKILKLVTGKEYNHASISLRPDLGIMYSFGRRHPYNPFWGGFVMESPFFGTFKRFSETEAVVLAVDIDAEVYEKIRTTVHDMLRERKKYRYNYIGLWLAALHIHYSKKKSYYCSEFVGDILKKFGIEGSENLSAIIHPAQFLTLPYTTVYCGKLKDYYKEFSAGPVKA